MGGVLFLSFKKVIATKSVFILDIVIITLNIIQVVFYLRKHVYKIDIPYLYFPFYGIILYLITSIIVRNFWVIPKIKKALVEQNIIYQEVDVKPTFLNNILWTINVRVKDGYLVGYYSIFIKGVRQVKFVSFNNQLNLFETNNIELFQLLKRFKKVVNNWYALSIKEQQLYFNDVRYGFRSSDLNETRYAEEYKIIVKEGTYDLEKKINKPTTKIVIKLIRRYFNTED